MLSKPRPAKAIGGEEEGPSDNLVASVRQWGVIVHHKQVGADWVFWLVSKFDWHCRFCSSTIIKGCQFAFYDCWAGGLYVCCRDCAWAKKLKERIPKKWDHNKCLPDAACAAIHLTHKVNDLDG